MLITEKLETQHFSASEGIIVDFLLQHPHRIKDLTTTQIAEETFSSKSTLVRVAQKLQFSGWKEFKEAFLSEIDYLDKTVNYVDANYPFGRYDSFQRIASKIAKLKQEVTTETLELLDPNHLEKIIQVLAKSQTIHIFATSNNLLLTKEFALQMNRIGKDVRVHDLSGETYFNAYFAQENSCALMISYSGENLSVIRSAKILKDKKIPMVLITSLGENQMTQYTDLILRLSTREKLYSKISSFATDESILYLLDTLYACVFSLDYDHNTRLRIEASRILEVDRSASSSILKE
ncbi:MurR/RpiR family transcriptional regulator [Streptococcus merionis]|uniref:SIS (Sugar ISomerase) domain containing transcriptional regulator n=1 Tax=Streptococcus merionis TaxID=400065 RepID=A0A239SPW1_9STRE|nr:MurR/RpiR family transcriptional regulator [Streptococcus merionis]SNU87299.1 SIS (Sugar ISomerase) domain containing transcriptional regulator [Streptococcus merionis]